MLFCELTAWASQLTNYRLRKWLLYGHRSDLCLILQKIPPVATMQLGFCSLLSHRFNLWVYWCMLPIIVLLLSPVLLADWQQYVPCVCWCGLFWFKLHRPVRMSTGLLQLLCVSVTDAAASECCHNRPHYGSCPSVRPSVCPSASAPYQLGVEKPVTGVRSSVLGLRGERAGTTDGRTDGRTSCRHWAEIFAC